MRAYLICSFGGFYSAEENATIVLTKHFDLLCMMIVLQVAGQSS